MESEAMRLYKLRKMNPDQIMDEGFALLNTDPQKALEAFELALQVPGCKPRALLYKAQALSNLGRHEEAIPEFTRYLDEAKGPKEAWNNLGLCYQKTKRLEEAENAFLKALALDRNYSAALCNISVAVKRRGDLRRALEYALQVVRVDPDGPGYYNLACYHSLLGNQHQALAALDRAIAKYDGKWREAAKNDGDFEPIRGAKEFQQLISGQRYVPPAGAAPQYAYDIQFAGDGADGWYYGRPPGIMPEQWPRGRNNGIPMTHLFTVRLPEEYRCRGPEYVALSVFQACEGDAGSPPVDGVEEVIRGAKTLAQLEPQAEAAMKVWEAIAAYARGKHPMEVHVKDVVGCGWCFLYLTAAEFAGAPCALPYFDASFVEDYDNYQPHYDRADPPRKLRLARRADDPNAGRIISADDDDPDYIPVFSERGEELNLDRFGTSPHFGGTSHPVQDEPEGYGPYYLEFDEGLGGANLGGDGAAQLDFGKDWFTWACG